VDWNSQQERALKAVDRWIKDDSESCPQVFRLFGFAGTGKTTLAKHLAANVDGLVLFAAYTGRAAHVLLKNGAPNADTIHALIYYTAEKSKEKLKELQTTLDDLIKELKLFPLVDDKESTRKKFIDEHVKVISLRRQIKEEKSNASKPYFVLNQDSRVKDAKLLVIDEVSMVNEEMGRDLESFGTKILVLGDPFQLQPTMGLGYFTSQEPDILLTQVMRHDNDILELATNLREKIPLKVGHYGDVSIITPEELNSDMAMDADQILLGTNKKRHAINRRMRQLHGYPENYPVAGDKIVCTRNEKAAGLLNGAIWYVNETFAEDDKLERMGEVELMIKDSPSSEHVKSVLAHTNPFLGLDLPAWAMSEASCFDWGYALTVHKAQGSQFENVLLFDHSRVFRREKWQWLYTGVTRAQEKLTIVV